jgi:hypothetical protein
VRRGIAFAALAVTAALLPATPSGAAQTHPFEAAVGAGELSFPGGLAVDDANGDLYVADPGAEAVVRFDSNGAPAEFTATGTNSIGGIAFDGSATQVAVAQSGPNAGDFYVTNSFGGGIQAFTAAGAPAPFSASGSYISANTLSGTPSEGYSEACGVAVDGNGAIYVGDFGGFVDVYAASGEFLTQFATTSPCAVAVDSAGNVYASEFNGAVTAHSPTVYPVTASTAYGAATVIDAAAGFGVAVDPANDQVYVNEGQQLRQFESLAAGSAPIVSFGSPQLGEESRGVAVDRSGGARDGDVYTSAGTQVDRFGPLVTIPDVTTEAATGVGVGGATLRGSVNPQGVPINACEFEYGPEPSYGAGVPCAESPAAISAGGASVAVHADLTGLAPGLYHFRLTVLSANGSASGGDLTVAVPGQPLGPPSPSACANAAIRAQQPAAQLPDCRAYELVSPPDKNGTDVKNNNSVQAAFDGDGAVFSSLGGFADSPSATVLSYYRAQRGADGWATRGISPPVVPQGNAILSTSMMDVSSDLGEMVMRAFPAPPTAPGDQPRASDFYRRSIPDGPFENLTSEVERPEELENSAFYVAGNDSLSTIGVNSSLPLSSEAPADGSPQGYVWQGGSMHYVGVLPGPSPAPESYVGGVHGAETQRAISADGSQVVFTARSEGSLGLYLRKGFTTTVKVSASRRTPPDPTPRSAEYQGASVSGDRIFFISEEQLLNSDTDGVPDLYVFAPATESLRRISLDAEPADGEEANVAQVLGVSEDGARLYFAAQGSLVPGQPQAPGMHVYSWRDSGGPDGTLAYVASLDPSLDSEDWSSQISAKQRRVQVSPDGRYLLFSAATRLGSFDNAGHTELHRYDAESGDAVCVSCDPSGAAAVSDASMFGLQGPVVNGIEAAGFTSRNVLDDGRVFFETTDPLVLGDANGQEDVYEWEQGRPALLSTGRSPLGSHFGDASASGDDVFFLTAERLVSSDLDNNVDLYDVRVGGGLAGQNALPAAGCEGEGCRDGAPPPPAAAAPGSASVFGPGNPRHRRHHHKRHRRHRKKGHHGGKHRHAGKHHHGARNGGRHG